MPRDEEIIHRRDAEYAEVTQRKQAIASALSLRSLRLCGEFSLAVCSVNYRIVWLLYFVLFLSGTALGQERYPLDQPPATDKQSSKQPPLSQLRYPIATAVVSERYGIQQVGEAKAEAARQSIVHPHISGPDEILAKADQLVENGKLNQAVELYRKVLGTQPQMASARMGLGYALIELGDFDGAAREFKEVSARMPNNAEAELNLGVALYRSGHIAEAIGQYERALAGREQAPALHFNLAMAYAHQGDFDKAILNYQAAIKERGNYPEACNNLGLVYQAMGKIDAARAQFRLAIEQRRGRYPLAIYNLARTDSLQGHFDEAAAQFRSAIKQQANFPEAYLCLGNIRLLNTDSQNVDRLAESISFYKQAIALRNNNYPLAHENLAIALTKLRKIEGALAEYRTAFDQYEGWYSPETLLNLIATIEDKTLFFIGDEVSRADSPGNLKSSKDGIKFGPQMGDALKEYEELDDELKDLPNVHYCVGRIYIAVGNWKAAVNELARAVELSGSKDSEAKRVLNLVMELALYL